MNGTENPPISLVTGASRGIGRGIALALAGVGFDIGVNYARNKNAADEVCVAIAAFGRKAIAIRGDVSIGADREQIVEETASRLGPISLLVNNAGVAPNARADVLEAGEESFDRLMSTNLKGPYFLTQLVARRMIDWRTSGAIEHPKIVFITSISAFAPSTNRGDYCMSKAALSMAAKLFAARLAAEGIGVYEVQPGIIRTDMTAKVKERYDRLIEEEDLLPIRRWGQPEDVGKAVVAIAEGHFDYATGIAIQVDGGFHLRIL